MSDDRTRLILTVLIVVSLMTMIAGGLGWLGVDTTGERLNLSLVADEIQVDDQPAVTESDDQTDEDLKQLSINLEMPPLETEVKMRRWPAESSLETIRRTDLEKYIGRSADSRPLEGITVFLDPGHGGSDSGATYPAHAIDPVYTEARINLEVAKKTREQLIDLGATVVLIRQDNIWQSIFYRIAYASRVILDQFQAELASLEYTTEQVDHLGPLMDQIMESNNDFESTGGRGIMNGAGATPDLKLLLDIEYQFPEVVYLSIHCNSLEDNDPSGGLQVYYLSSDAAYVKENEFGIQQNLAETPPVYSMYRDADRQRLASLIKSGILERIPQLEYQGEDDLIDENYAVLRELNVTGALIELGFISSPNDREILLSDSKQEKMAQAIAEAVYSYYCKSE